MHEDRGGKASQAILKRRVDAPAGICPVLHDGAACDRPVATRGVCKRHYARLRWNGELDRLFGVTGTGFRQHRPGNLKAYSIKLVSEEEPGICRIVVDQESCRRPAKRRGLCVACYGGIWQRQKLSKDLRLEDFALPRPDKSEPVYARRRDVHPGQCVLRIGLQACESPASIRGLCAHHHAWLLQKNPAILERIADQIHRDTIYTVRSLPRTGRCRIQENGVGCHRVSWSRGLCHRHYAKLKRRPDFESFAERETAFRVGSAPPGTCHLVVNDVACTSPVTNRGLCRKHYKLICARGPGELDRLGAPVPALVLAVKSQVELVDGLCRVQEDGEACRTPEAIRGLCRRHARLAQRIGMYDSLALPTQSTGKYIRPTSSPHSSVLPLLYLDKNILFDYVDRHVFAEQADSSSCALVAGAVSGKLIAYVSTDAVKGVYSRIRYRLRRPIDEGGRGLTVDEAERITQEAVRTIFQTKGTWRFIAISAADFARGLAQKSSMSTEDIWEWMAFQEARKHRIGPKWFVTRDRGFPEGVSPADVVRVQLRVMTPTSIPNYGPKKE